MPLTLAFDVYGTLIDTHSLTKELKTLVSNKAQAFSNTWRDKQLEYSFRRGLMQNYQPFSVCTRDALEYACEFYKARLTEEQKNSLLQGYRTLPAFDDVTASLHQLADTDYRLFAFSNGTAEAVQGLLDHAGIADLFEGVVSVDEVKSFKPNLAVYHHFLRRTNSRADATWLVSSNPFDVIGGVSVGMCAAWLQRSGDAVFDPWGIAPTVVIKSLSELGETLSST